MAFTVRRLLSLFFIRFWVGCCARRAIFYYIIFPRKQILSSSFNWIIVSNQFSLSFKWGNNLKHNNRCDFIPQLGEVLRPERYRAVLFENRRRGRHGMFICLFFRELNLKKIFSKKRWPSVCLLASSAASRTGYSPPVRKIRRRWKWHVLPKLWCYLWWLSPVLVRMQRRTRNRCGRRKRLSTRLWRTWRTPRRKGRRRERRAEDDKLFLRNLKEGQT